jgi:hypothetical protein
MRGLQRVLTGRFSGIVSPALQDTLAARNPQAHEANVGAGTILYLIQMSSEVPFSAELVMLDHPHLWLLDPSAYQLENAHVVSHRCSAHVEDAGQ